MGFAGISEAHYLYQVFSYVNLYNNFAMTISYLIFSRSDPSTSCDRNVTGGILLLCK